MNKSPMRSKKVVIVDFGAGNLFSIEKAVNHAGGMAEITDAPEKIASADRLVLPGVGAFGIGMQRLREKWIGEAIIEFSRTGRPLLGVCLGMQFLLTESFEFGFHAGLNLIPGRVIRLTEAPPGEITFKIPDIGWNSISLPSTEHNSPGFNWEGTLLIGITPGTFFYFVHSYICIPDDESCILAETDYGLDRFCSVLKKDNIWGVQFHPERSAASGLIIYKNFLDL